MNFLDRVLNLIETKDTTKNKLAIDLKLAKGSIANWQDRGTVPSGDIILKIAQYFHVSTDYLLTGVENKSINLSNDEKRLFEYYSRLSDLEKGELLGELKAKVSNDESKRDA